jgi:hypothetical protein
VTLATNTPAALGFLLLGLVATAALIFLFLTRQQWSDRLLNFYLDRAEKARPRTRWLYFPFTGRKWADDDYRRQQGIGLQFPVMSAVAIVAFAEFAAAAAHF